MTLDHYPLSLPLLPYPLRLRNVHFSVLIFAFSIMSAIMSAAMIPIFSEYKLPKTSEEWAYAIFVGIFGILGQSLLAIALK